MDSRLARDLVEVVFKRNPSNIMGMETADGKVFVPNRYTNILSGKRALVTGAGTRVGRAIACALGARGMRVAVAYHQSEEGARSVAQEIETLGGHAMLYQADLSLAGAGKRLVEAVLLDGPLDVLVPSAANFERVDFDEIDDGHWERALQLNVRASFDMVQAACPALRSTYGAIVFITGYCTAVPYPGYLPYVVSKGAARQLMRVLSVELAPEIRVNAVAPGTVFPPVDYSPEQIATLAAQVPLGRTGSAEAVAQAVVHLAEADYTTGQELFVDGGRSIRAR